MKSINNFGILCLLAAASFLSGCKKLVSIGEPTDKITASKLFNTDAGARSAMAGVYSLMVNGSYGQSTYDGTFSLFAGGESTLLGALSADEMLIAHVFPPFNYNSNHLIAAEAYFSDVLWSSAYSVIYGANAVIEGIAASTSPKLRENVRVTLTNEAKFVRAFSYCYLVNFFGDLPLVLIADPYQVANLSRSPQTAIYEQIVKDLKDAQAGLPADYSGSDGRRVRAVRWAATALLARVYLYTGNYTGAAEQASAVIGETGLFNLENDLNSVFLTGSREAIWQLAQTTENPISGNSTGEGYTFLPNPLNTGPISLSLSTNLLNAFEPNDQRREAWVDSTEFSFTPGPVTLSHFAHKYKTGAWNAVIGGAATEYYLVLRLAEQYLIRAEANANNGGSVQASIDDLNIIRSRAGLPNLPGSLSQEALLNAIAQEWRIEFFCEWGHRWFNLKRTKKAHEVLSVIPYKQPWAGDYQLLYPIPVLDTLYNNALSQNPGY